MTTEKATYDEPFACGMCSEVIKTWPHKCPESEAFEARHRANAEFYTHQLLSALEKVDQDWANAWWAAVNETLRPPVESSRPSDHPS